MTEFPNANTIEVLAEVADERVAQVEKWGIQTLPDVASAADAEHFERLATYYKASNAVDAQDGTIDWAGVLLEEVYEALAEAYHNPAALRAELVQVVAVGVAWIEDIDYKEGDA